MPAVVAMLIASPLALGAATPMAPMPDEGALAEPTVAGTTGQLPTSGAEALALYESDVEGWLDGPVRHIAVEEERDIWDRLDSDAARRRFIDWFWSRRDEDLRDSVNPFRRGFYQRVAEANARFPGIPRGWRSDRGHVWIVLGRPDSMRAERAAGGIDVTVWIYHAPGLSMTLTDTPTQLQVGFARTRRGWEVVGDFGATGSFPLSLLSLFEQIARATIVNPDLELVGR